MYVDLSVLPRATIKRTSHGNYTLKISETRKTADSFNDRKLRHDEVPFSKKPLKTFNLINSGPVITIADFQGEFSWKSTRKTWWVIRRTSSWTTFYIFHPSSLGCSSHPLTMSTGKRGRRDKATEPPLWDFSSLKAVPARFTTIRLLQHPIIVILLHGLQAMLFEPVCCERVILLTMSWLIQALSNDVFPFSLENFFCVLHFQIVSGAAPGSDFDFNIFLMEIII